MLLKNIQAEGVAATRRVIEKEGEVDTAEANPSGVTLRAGSGEGDVILSTLRHLSEVRHAQRRRSAESSHLEDVEIFDER